MGRAKLYEIVHATEPEMQHNVWNFDVDGQAKLGFWQQIVINDHVRLILEKLKHSHYCCRSLIRSVLIFEMIEEFAAEELWIGRIYYRDTELKILNTVARTEDLGETGFRKRYQELGGQANW